MVILSRALKMDVDAGVVEISARIFLTIEKEDHWQCEYEIDWPNGVRKKKAYGIDSVQSLLIAVQLIGIEIYTSEAHRSGKLMWQAMDTDFLFPREFGISMKVTTSRRDVSSS